MRRKHLTFGIVFLLLCSFIALIAVSQQKTVTQLVAEMDSKKDALYLPPNGAWPVYEAAFDVLEDRILTVMTKVKAQRGIKIDSTDPKDNTLKVKKSSVLSQEIRDALAAVDTEREVVEDKWLDAYDAWQAYHNAVAAYNSHPHVSPEERLSVPGLDKLVATSLYSCAGSCDDIFETDSLAQYSHQAYCSEKHGSSGTTGVTYYTCYGNTTCDRSDEHWQLCGGRCGNKFPPRRVNRGQGNYDYVAHSPHYITCQVSGCDTKYYTCEHSSCPKSNTHGGSTPPSGSNPPPPPTDNTPNCQDCTSDCGSPCSCTNSGTCGGTVTTPPDDPPSESCSGNCWYGEGCAVTCVHCLEPYNLCTSQPGDCSVDPHGWHSSE